jgi:hypothetical protein
VLHLNRGKGEMVFEVQSAARAECRRLHERAMKKVLYRASRRRRIAPDGGSPAR